MNQISKDDTRSSPTCMLNTVCVMGRNSCQNKLVVVNFDLSIIFVKTDILKRPICKKKMIIPDFELAVYYCNKLLSCH